MIAPSLVYDDAPAAIAWLERAFGLTEIFRVPGDRDEILYAELRYGTGVMMVETAPDNDLNLASPLRCDHRSSGVCVTVVDVDSHHATAIANGATVVREPADLPHARQYSALDCEGHLWTFGTYTPGTAPDGAS